MTLLVRKAYRWTGFKTAIIDSVIQFTVHQHNNHPLFPNTGTTIDFSIPPLLGLLNTVMRKYSYVFMFVLFSHIFQPEKPQIFLVFLHGSRDGSFARFSIHYWIISDTFFVCHHTFNITKVLKVTNHAKKYMCTGNINADSTFSLRSSLRSEHYFFSFLCFQLIVHQLKWPFEKKNPY
jgi:hypothetical protein